MWRIWHNLLLRFDKDKTVYFMNYGYAGLNGDKKLDLDIKDDENRYCIQLYDQVVNRVNLRDKKVIEIGSGRGGGASYIARYYKPLQYTGVDISSGVIKFCNEYYNVPNLSFTEGKAEKIPFGNDSFHAVVNVESARCYSNMKVFFKEVYRILQAKGHFLFADMIEPDSVDKVKKDLVSCGFRIHSERNITMNVAKGLELDTIRRENQIQNKVPVFLRKSFEKFAGTKGSTRYDSFSNGQFQYWSFVLAKN